MSKHSYLRRKTKSTNWLVNLFVAEELFHFYFPHWNKDNLFLLFEEWLYGYQVTQEALSNTRLQSII